jgi:hypothetical protein
VEIRRYERFFVVVLNGTIGLIFANREQMVKSNFVSRRHRIINVGNGWQKLPSYFMDKCSTGPVKTGLVTTERLQKTGLLRSGPVFCRFRN